MSQCINTKYRSVEDDENNFKGFKKIAKFVGSLARDNSQTRLRKLVRLILIIDYNDYSPYISLIVVKYPFHFEVETKTIS